MGWSMPTRPPSRTVRAFVALHRELARIEAVTARASAQWDAKQEWAADGARSGAAWLAAKLRVPKEQARRTLRLGRAMRNLPCAAAAWLAGRVAGAHVSALAAARTSYVAEAMARDEAELVDEATRLSYRGFQRRLE